VIWGCEGVEFREDGKQSCVNYRADLMEGYMSQVLGWLNANADTLRIARWYWYSSAPQPEPYATEFNGIALFEGLGRSQPSRFGLVYRQFSEALAAGGAPAAPPVAAQPPPAEPAGDGDVAALLQLILALVDVGAPAGSP
jgi:hypothetical protein